MDPFVKQFNLVLEELLKKKNIEENLSRIVRFLEDEIKFQSLGIFLKVPRSMAYRIKISRQISHHYAKITQFTENDPLISDLNQKSIIDLKDGKKLKFEKDYSHLIIIPLHNNDVLQGFIFMDKADDEFSSDDILKTATVAKIVSLGVDLDNLREELSHAKEIDEITGFFTYKAFYERCEAQFTLMKRYTRPMSLAILRIDDYEKIIQTIGKENCDTLIRLITETIKKNLRDSDILGVLYRDYYGILMPETDINNNLIAVKRMDEIINKIPQMKNKNIGWGLIELNDKISNVDDFIAKAREAATESCRKTVYKYTVHQE